jgi:hypothetical protein
VINILFFIYFLTSFALFSTLLFFVILHLFVPSNVFFNFTLSPPLRVSRYRRDYPANDLLSERIAVCLLSPYNTLVQAGQLACCTLQILLREDINRFVNDTTPVAGRMVNLWLAFLEFRSPLKFEKTFLFHTFLFYILLCHTS